MSLGQFISELANEELRREGIRARFLSAPPEFLGTSIQLIVLNNIFRLAVEIAACANLAMRPETTSAAQDAFVHTRSELVKSSQTPAEKKDDIFFNVTCGSNLHEKMGFFFIIQKHGIPSPGLYLAVDTEGRPYCAKIIADGRDYDDEKLRQGLEIPLSFEEFSKNLMNWFYDNTPEKFFEKMEKIKFTSELQRLTEYIPTASRPIGRDANQFREAAGALAERLEHMLGLSRGNISGPVGQIVTKIVDPL